VSKNTPFNMDVFAEDLGSPDYTVTLVTNSLPADLHLQTMRCNGTKSNSPSPDTPACEYDANTTTLRTITETEYQFLWSGSTNVTFSVQVCAASFTNPPSPFPTGGSCVSKAIRVSP
jgi:hypothetical protein